MLVAVERLLAVALCCLVLGCATPFRSLPREALAAGVELGPDEGILIIHTATDVPVAALQAGEAEVARNLREGVRYEFVIAKAGRYRWTSASLGPPARRGRYWRNELRFWDIDYWEFRVEPGVINYPGQMILYTRTGVVNARVANRSGQMWLILRDRFPELADRYPVVYTGALRDDFFSHVRPDGAVGGAAE